MNITLIGMPGSGKSTTSKLLAKELGFNLIELDSLYERENDGVPLQILLDTEGETLTLQKQCDSAITNTLTIDNAIVSPGGSLIYTEPAMEHLKNISKIIYLKASLPTITKRIEGTARGLVMGKHKTLDEVYASRILLYEKWAEVTVDAEQAPERVVESILQSL
jgi:shikimate kinase